MSATSLPLLDPWGHGEGIAHDSVEPGDLVAAMVPCPGRMIRGGAGGQAMTSCSWCGEVMASTAGPHSRDGMTVRVLVAEDVIFDRKAQRIVLTRPLLPSDLDFMPLKRDLPPIGSRVRRTKDNNEGRVDARWGPSVPIVWVSGMGSAVTTHRVQRLEPCIEREHWFDAQDGTGWITLPRCCHDCCGDGFKWVTVCEYEDNTDD